MITRFAIFEGTINAGQDEEFRAAVKAEILPHWLSFPGARDVRLSFTEEADEGAPSIPMILQIDYDDMAAVDAALASPERGAAKAATENLLPRFFTGRIHHHITTKVV
ncbi:hypothetical protein EDD53_2576 [Pacificibacter maritimus]|uniref:Antibiotic biosynthesis monooxygenase n=1 Tax=Pacificibacter maritimus TaxID=762213 RepID=A0A3N4U2T1_9RHOB|nr:hypothetical protein [Pacificibacter maritimus]RPE64812.1 hypothetical protein EDD53_2576 [Pacificibacter maritimus]